ncbi:barstar family protein [Wenzhouxiangella sp. XN24]|uniref:barstar family protein n=1 Tax=Wenzhouxiangella sp. XN24 TaxID=2713569 RepID=UPI001980CEDD
MTDPAQLRDAGKATLAAVAPRSAGELLEAARAAGLHGVPIDLAGCRDKAGFLARMAAALEFPACFGQNWDALADYLGDLEWVPAEGYLLLLENGADFRDAAGEDYRIAIGILAATVATWREREIPFWVFVAEKKDET